MYALLLRFLPRTAANIAIAVIYAILILAAIYFTWLAPQAEFRYGEI